MAQHFIASIPASFLFVFGAALFYFQDRFMVLPLAMFTFPTVLFLGIPMAIAIDWLLKPIGNTKPVKRFFIESLLYVIAGVAATGILFLIVTGRFVSFSFKFYLLGASASYVYFLCLSFVRLKGSKASCSS
ncbi:hypothetical protein [Brevibacillus borstelensis]|uniref:hypothetical protein n=1 Tax=Brevibacillus borstelensis TaxID=45462 RepID=UPI003CF16A9D